MSYWSPEYLMGRWQPTIGDPTFMGWFTVFSYFACAVVAFIAVFVNQMGGRRSVLFWAMIAFLMILLGINKQLDVQSLLTEIGRQVAKAQGWIDNRRPVQFWGIVIFGITALAAFSVFVLMFRRVFRRFMLAFVGLFVLVSFIIIRAASFHHFDQILGFTFLGARVNWILELTGIYLILCGGVKEILYLRRLNTRW